MASIGQIDTARGVGLPPSPPNFETGAGVAGAVAAGTNQLTGLVQTFARAQQAAREAEGYASGTAIIQDEANGLTTADDPAAFASAYKQRVSERIESDLLQNDDSLSTRGLRARLQLELARTSAGVEAKAREMIVKRGRTAMDTNLLQIANSYQNASGDAELSLVQEQMRDALAAARSAHLITPEEAYATEVNWWEKSLSGRVLGLASAGDLKGAAALLEQHRGDLSGSSQASIKLELEKIRSVQMRDFTEAMRVAASDSRGDASATTAAMRIDRVIGSRVAGGLLLPAEARAAQIAGYNASAVDRVYGFLNQDKLAAAKAELAAWLPGIDQHVGHTLKDAIEGYERKAADKVPVDAHDYLAASKAALQATGNLPTDFGQRAAQFAAVGGEAGKRLMYEAEKLQRMQPQVTTFLQQSPGLQADGLRALEQSIPNETSGPQQVRNIELLHFLTQAKTAQDSAFRQDGFAVAQQRGLIGAMPEWSLAPDVVGRYATAASALREKGWDVFPVPANAWKQFTTEVAKGSDPAPIAQWIGGLRNFDPDTRKLVAARLIGQRDTDPQLRVDPNVPAGGSQNALAWALFAPEATLPGIVNGVALANAKQGAPWKEAPAQTLMDRNYGEFLGTAPAARAAALDAARAIYNTTAQQEPSFNQTKFDSALSAVFGANVRMNGYQTPMLGLSYSREAIEAKFATMSADDLLMFGNGRPVFVPGAQVSAEITPAEAAGGVPGAAYQPVEIKLAEPRPLVPQDFRRMRLSFYDPSGKYALTNPDGTAVYTADKRIYVFDLDRFMRLSASAGVMQQLEGTGTYRAPATPLEDPYGALRQTPSRIREPR